MDLSFLVDRTVMQILPETRAEWVGDLLVGRLACLLVGWFVCWLVGWLVGWFVCLFHPRIKTEGGIWTNHFTFERANKMLEDAGNIVFLCVSRRRGSPMKPPPYLHDVLFWINTSIASLLRYSVGFCF